MYKKENKILLPNDVLLKAANYCAYQERCHEEVKQRLAELGVYGTRALEIISELIRLNYLNEERFAKAYAGGKFRIKKWGRNRIIYELKLKKISEYCISESLKEIDQTDYLETLQQLATEKIDSLKDKNILIKKNKTAKFLIGKGYEANLVWDILNK